MKKPALLLVLVLTGGICFSQQISFAGEKTWFDGNLYRIQVGAYRNIKNAELAYEKLRSGGLEPLFRQNQGLHRVVIIRVGARDIPAVANTIASLGFREIWITREEARSEHRPRRIIIHRPTGDLSFSLEDLPRRQSF